MKAWLRRTVPRILGLAAICILIWYVGPLFAFARWSPLETEFARVVAIGSLLGLCALGALVRWVLAKRSNIRMVVDMMANAGVQSQHAVECSTEVDVLRSRFEEALKILKRARLGDRSFWARRRYLYQLPWYVLVGSPGSGKTTSLLNSGLTFPLANRVGKAELGGVGGTRNCDWWFSDDAVLVDTAGRYVTQDSNAQVDKAAWSGFLTLLKKYRRRQPINGVLVTVSVADILQQSEIERQSHAHVIRSRLQEFYDQLAIKIPVYVLITKCDLLPGFAEYFADLPRSEREQVWGTSLALATATGPHYQTPDFAAEFAALAERLEERLLARMQAERDPEKRALIFGFPAQFQLATRELSRFLIDVFQPTRFEDRTLLRGVYWTSATQEGTPIDRVMGALAASYGIDPQTVLANSGKGKGYFLTRVLQDVIFGEAGLAGTDLGEERRQAWYRSGVVLVAMAAASVLAAGWYVSYLHNRAYVDDVATKTAEAQSHIAALANRSTDVVEALPVLNTLRKLPGGYEEFGENHPLLWGLGLFQGDKLGSEAVSRYRESLTNVFHTRLLQRLEDQLRNSSDTEFSYEGLRVYLMLFDPERFELAAVTAWFELDWERNLARDAVTTRQELQQHLAALLERQPLQVPIKQDIALIEEVRRRLTRTPLAERIYSRLKRSPAAQKLPEFKVSDAAGRDAPLVLTRRSGVGLSSGVPGLYTYTGYHEVFKKSSAELIARLTDDSWVYGSEGGIETSDKDQAVQLVHRLYLDDYIRQWDALLADIDLVEFHSPDEGARIMSLLSAQDSPLRQLIAAVVRETTLEKTPANQGALQSGVQAGVGLVARNALNNASYNLRELIGIGQATAQGMRQPAGAPAPPPEAAVTSHFKPLAVLLEQPNGGVAPIDKSLQLFGALATYLNGVAGAARRGESSAAVQGSEIIGQLKMDAPRQPAPLGDMMRSVTTRSGSISRGSERHRLNSLWGATIVPFCQRGIDGRYPLTRVGSQEVTPEDFGRFFGPNGLLDDFFQKNLRNFVDSSGPVWRWSRAEGGTLGISPAVLGEFQRGAAIKEVFFRGGTPTPAVRFELRPVRMDAEIAEFTLDVGGQAFSYSHGPILSTTMEWPASGGSKTVRVQISPPAPTGRSTISEQGPWGLFRLLDKAEMSAASQPERFNVTFNVDGRRATFELAASSVLNPFQLRALDEFHCPASL